MKEAYRVMLVDDHEHGREGMRDILADDPSFRIEAEACSGEEALDKLADDQPDLILMDIRMPGMGGLEAARRIKQQYPRVKTVMVTVSDDIAHLFEALKKGAQGYLLKNLKPSSWLEYLHAIAADEAPMSRELALRILQEMVPREPAPAQGAGKSPLTAREREILECVAKGHSNRDVSEELGISENTVKNHLKNIMQKLHMDNRTQLSRYAYEQGWIQ